MNVDFDEPIPPVQEPAKRNNTLVIVVVVVVVLLCCCCVSAILAWNYGDLVMQSLGLY